MKVQFDEVNTMVQIIETNLSVTPDGLIKDHQSRIIKANSWDEYCKAFEEYSGEEVEFKVLSQPGGASLCGNYNMENLKYDEFHLSCDVHNGYFGLKKLAALIEWSD